MAEFTLGSYFGVALFLIGIFLLGFGLGYFIAINSNIVQGISNDYCMGNLTALDREFCGFN